MAIEAIRRALEEGRFPITVWLADGRKYVVPHRDFMFLTPKGDTVFLVTDEDRYHLVDTALITEVGFSRRPASKRAA